MSAAVTWVVGAEAVVGAKQKVCAPAVIGTRGSARPRARREGSRIRAR
ncbi:MAG: hypothetical protein IPF99_18160 [Deltaproteobacteria bacterium]|nr:hypothetical protein [Deltaproteobacteria bacterium]